MYQHLYKDLICLLQTLRVVPLATVMTAPGENKDRDNLPVEGKVDGIVISVLGTVVLDIESAALGVGQRHSNVSGVFSGHDTNLRSRVVSHDVILHSQDIHLDIHHSIH